jgi:hypothetical protein
MFERRINGRIYHVQSHHKTKIEADKEAAWLRKNGKHARIFSAAMWAKHYGDKSARWLVYTY